MNMKKETLSILYYCFTTATLAFSIGLLVSIPLARNSVDPTVSFHVVEEIIEKTACGVMRITDYRDGLHLHYKIKGDDLAVFEIKPYILGSMSDDGSAEITCN